MSSAVRDILAQHRPRGFAGSGDKYLAEVARGLRRLLVKARFMAERGLTRACPPMKFAKEILECENGIGSFFYPAEGQEYMREFNPVLAGFKKQGQGLTENEVEFIRRFVESNVISPAFVLRMVREHGAQSIGAAYLIRDFEPDTDTAYLLRCHKGHFYRTRYPSLFLIGEVAP